MPARSTPEKFWSRVCKRSDGECWEWLGARNGEGYGKLKYHQKDWQSHRLALELTRGPLPEGICVLHSCDNPICCNPYHLTSGTNQDNIDDRMAKGRTVIRGTVLSIAQVQEIRELLLAETSQTAIQALRRNPPGNQQDCTGAELEIQMKVVSSNRVPIKMWTDGVQVEHEAALQLTNLSNHPCVGPHVAVMPDVHWGMGSTVGSVIPTQSVIIPAAVGVDLGCGMMAVKLNITANDLPDNLAKMRSNIEKAIPHGRTDNGGPNDRGAWGVTPALVGSMWSQLQVGYAEIIDKSPKLDRGATHSQLGTLGTGNHFVEVCLDESNDVWLMLHSGSRGVGNRIGSHFIELAKKEMERWHIHLPDKDLAYLPEGSEHFEGYVRAVTWAQSYAKLNRSVMMHHALQAVVESLDLSLGVTITETAVNCHHNYISRENHFGKNLWITRKGAVRARVGDLGIIPGSMGAKSFIVRGKGNAQSFNSCSHGAGRAMSRTEAKKRFTLADHATATAGVECRKDDDVIDETPQAYKDIDAVMAAQTELVDIVHTLKQVLCVKG